MTSISSCSARAPAATRAAFRAAQLGLKVALVDQDKIGGTCLHRGCIPTKALLESAAFTDRVRHAKDYGLILPGEAVVDYAAMAARRDAVVKRMWTGLKTLIDKNKVTWVAGPRPPRRARQGPRQPAGRGRHAGRRRRARPQRDRRHPRDGLAGQVAARASTPDGKRIVTSDDILKMDTLPKDIVIVGAGAVGVEFASMYPDVGVKVTLLEYLPQIVPLEDADVSKLVERSFTKRGMTVMTNARFDAASVTSDEGGICLMVGPEGKEPAELRAELMLVATGRAANIEDIGLETTKVETDRGVIKVNGRMRTQEPHVYAIGDVDRRPVARPHRGARGAHRRAHDRRRRRRPRDGLHDPAAGDLLPAGDRLDRADRGSRRPPPGPSSRSARSRSRRSPRRSSAASTRASPRSSPMPRPTTRSASTSSGRTPPTSSPRHRSASSSRRRPGRSAARPTRIRPSPRSSAKRPWRSTGGRSTSSAAQVGPAPGDSREAGPARWP